MGNARRDAKALVYTDLDALERAVRFGRVTVRQALESAYAMALDDAAEPNRRRDDQPPSQSGEHALKLDLSWDEDEITKRW